MAKPTKIKNKNGSTSYRVFISNKITGKRESKTFSTRALASSWSDNREKEIEKALVHGDVSDYLIRDILKLYQEQFSTNYGMSKYHDINRLQNYDIANLMISQLSAKHIIQHCIERNREAKPQNC